jgi:hypothetical protein
VALNSLSVAWSLPGRDEQPVSCDVHGLEGILSDVDTVCPGCNIKYTARPEYCMQWISI